MSKILIAVPTYQGKNYCWLRFLANLDALFTDPHEVEYVLADNSKGSNYAQYLRNYGLTVLQVAPCNRIQDTLAKTHNALRNYFLKGDYDYMFHVESDLFPHSFALLDLLEMDAPVSTGIYFLNKGLKNFLCLFRLIEMGNEVGWEEVDTKYMGHFITGRPEQIYASGIGCALIRREVLENIQFRWDPKSNYHPDMFFYEDCYNLGFTVMAHTGMIVPHENQDWYENYAFTSKIVNK